MPLVVLLTVDGFHVPVIGGTFVELVGKTGAVAPLQKAGTAVKIGVTLGITVASKVAVVAHCPAVGVNV